MSTLSTSDHEASQALLSSAQMVPADECNQPDIESQTTTTPLDVPVSVPTVEVVVPPEDNGNLESLKQQRGIILAPLAVVAHASFTYGILQYLRKLHHQHPSFQLQCDVFISLCLISSFAFTVFWQCQGTEAKVRLAQAFAGSEMASWMLLIVTSVSLALVVSTVVVSRLYTLLILLSCGLLMSLVVALCGTATADVPVPSLNVLRYDGLTVYKGLSFPWVLYGLAFILIPDEPHLRKNAFFPILSGVEMILNGNLLCTLACTEWVNRYVGYYVLYKIVAITSFVIRWQW